MGIKEIKVDFIGTRAIHGGAGGHSFELRMCDVTSGALVVSVSLTPEQWALGLSGCHLPEVKAIVGPGHLFGLSAERKTEQVAMDDGQTQEHALALFCVDGWRPRDGDLGNHHRARGRLYSVSFSRHVYPDGTPVTDDSPDVLRERFAEAQAEIERLREQVAFYRGCAAVAAEQGTEG
jgi:hypothetical protein